ncbi:MAG: MCE family protein [Gemmatimonadetes bacterium]|nr:MCE family protein [Gemmatimonadota bacterium]
MRDPGLRDQYKTELQVGILLVVSFFAFILGVAWISGRQAGGDRLVVYALAPEAAAVTQGTPVTLLGVEVGSVRRISLRQDHVDMELAVSLQVQLPRDTRGEIKTSGFLGANVLALIPGVSTEFLASGDTITATPAPGLNELAGTLGDQAGRVLEQTRMLLSDSMIFDVHSAAGSLAAGMEDVQLLLDREAATLEELIEALNVAAGELAESAASPELDRTLANIDTLTARLAAASDDLDSGSQSLASILRKVDEGDGTLGKMVNDGELYDRLTAATENIQVASEEIALLTRDVREQPEKYLDNLKFSVF